MRERQNAMVVRRSGVALVLCALIASCSAPSKSGPIRSGFYRYSDEDGVYYVMPSMTAVCAVTSPAMMWAYGGFNEVNVVDHNVDFRATKRFAGNCPWPTGNYRNIGSPIVYHVANGTVCRLRAPSPPSSREVAYTIEKGQLAIRVVPPDSNMLSNVKFTGQCPSR